MKAKEIITQARSFHPRDLEPHFSEWMSEMTGMHLHEKGDIAVVLAILHRSYEASSAASLRGALKAASEITQMVMRRLSATTELLSFARHLDNCDMLKHGDNCTCGYLEACTKVLNVDQTITESPESNLGQ